MLFVKILFQVLLPDVIKPTNLIPSTENSFYGRLLYKFKNATNLSKKTVKAALVSNFSI